MKGRGLDFEQRFKTSRWAEDLLLDALNNQSDWIAVRFGLSEVKSADSLSKISKTTFKEPDLLVLPKNDLTKGQKKLITSINAGKINRAQLPDSKQLEFLLAKAFVAIEIEFSPYRAKEMKGRDWRPKNKEEWARRPLKHANPPVAPNIFIKEEDLAPLLNWEGNHSIPIVVTHIFDQEAFAIALKKIKSLENLYQKAKDDEERRCLQVTMGIFKKIQNYDRVDAQGAGERKTVYCVTPAASIKAADVTKVKVKSQLGVSSSKKYVSHVIFSGGHAKLTTKYLNLLKKA
jgi:hypothetical protein